MALIKCPECGKEVSDKATVCIHCGYPILSEKQQKPVNEHGEVVSNMIPPVVKKATPKPKKPVIIGVILSAFVIIGLIIGINKFSEIQAKKEYQAKLEAEQQAYQNMIEKSKENIIPYLKYIGEHYEAGEKISLPSNLYDNIENVEFMGMRGKIEFGTTAKSKKDDYYVRYCSWESFDAFSEEEFQAMAEDLNNYFGCEADADSRHYYSGSHTHRYYWIDPHSGFHVTYGHGLFSYHADGSIEIMWAIEFCEGSDFFGF